MIRLAAPLALVAAPVLAEPVEVPSGQPVTFVEVIHDAQGPSGLTYRFRFVAPQIARDSGGTDAETTAADMDYLCDSFAVPRVAVTGPAPSQIVISVSDRPVEFGQAAPEVTQFFEAYAVTEGSCIWEGF